MHTAFKIIIPRRSNECSLGQSKFEPKQAYHSVVTEADDGTFERRDYCDSCWEKERSSWAEKDVVLWKGKVPGKKNQPQYDGMSRDEKALAILRELLDVEEPTQEIIEDSFVLGLFLSRERVLLTRKQLEREGQRYQLYEISGKEEMIAVPYLELTDLHVAQVQQRVAKRLKG